MKTTVKMKTIKKNKTTPKINDINFAALLSLQHFIPYLQIVLTSIRKFFGYLFEYYYLNITIINIKIQSQFIFLSLFSKLFARNEIKEKKPKILPHSAPSWILS